MILQETFKYLRLFVGFGEVAFHVCWSQRKDETLKKSEFYLYRCAFHDAQLFHAAEGSVRANGASTCFL